MKVKFKKLVENAVIPSYSKAGDAGLDLTCTSITDSSDYNCSNIEEDGFMAELDYSILSYHTGIAVEIPEGYVGLLFPRSSIYKKVQILANSVGVIDSGYRGELIFKMKIDANGSAYWNDNALDLMEIYKVGDRVGQLVIIPYPIIEPEEVLELSGSERGITGYGSTGN